MKKLFTLILLPLLSQVSYGQAITIASTDVPIPGTFNCLDLSANPMSNPSLGPSQVWNYGTYTGTMFTNVYTTETSPVFTSVGVNVNYPFSKTLTSGFVYYQNIELAFTPTGVNDMGTSVQAQGYDLSTFTGSSSDSLIFPGQQILASTPRVMFQYPFTMSSSWSSSSRRAVNFTLTVTASSLSHAPGQHVFYMYRKDTVEGWGQLTVYTPSGPSIPYDVLLTRVAEYSTDSFYLYGAPAPTALLTSFGVTQGQRTDENYWYQFYRKGSYNYLCSFAYGNDSTMSSPTGMYQNTDNLIPLGIADNEKPLFTTLAFPNPVHGDVLNIAIEGTTFTNVSYSVTDVAGRTIYSGSAPVNNNILHLHIAGLPDGNYVAHIASGNASFSQKFTVAK